MILEDFSKAILGKNIPLFTIKTIIYMLATEQESLDIRFLKEQMYTTLQSISGDFKKTMPIEGFLSVEEDVENQVFKIAVLGKELSVYRSKSIGKNKNKKIQSSEVSSLDDAVLYVFNHWCETMGKKGRTTLDNARVKSIKRGLSNYTMEQCCLAITGCSKNLWNMAKTEKNSTLYNSIELIFRNNDNIERFISDSNLPSIDEQLIELDRKEIVKKGFNLEDRINNNDWLESRVNIVQGKSAEKILNDNTSISKDVLKIKNIDIEGLVLASEAYFYKNEFSYCESFIGDNINDKVIEGELITEIPEKYSKVEDFEGFEEADLPLYLRIHRGKTK